VQLNARIQEARDSSGVCRPTPTLPIISSLFQATAEPATLASEKTMTMDASMMTLDRSRR